MIPHKSHLYITPGDTEIFNFVVKDKDGRAYDLIDYDAYMRIEKSDGTEILTVNYKADDLETDLGMGKFVILLTADNTESLLDNQNDTIIYKVRIEKGTFEKTLSAGVIKLFNVVDGVGYGF